MALSARPTRATKSLANSRLSWAPKPSTFRSGLSCANCATAGPSATQVGQCGAQNQTSVGPGRTNCSRSAVSPVERSTTLTSGSCIATAAGEVAGDPGAASAGSVSAGLGVSCVAAAMAGSLVVSRRIVSRRTLHRHGGLRWLDNGFRRHFHGLVEDRGDNRVGAGARARRGC